MARIPRTSGSRGSILPRASLLQSTPAPARSYRTRRLRSRQTTSCNAFVDTVAARIGAAAEGFTLAEWRLREAGGSRDIYSLLCVPGAGEARRRWRWRLEGTTRIPREDAGRGW